jgi:hypothetical protein
LFTGFRKMTHPVSPDQVGGDTPPCKQGGAGRGLNNIFVFSIIFHMDYLSETYSDIKIPKYWFDKR